MFRFDKRHFKWFWQRLTRGFDDRELWSLDDTIAHFVAPRLRAWIAKGTDGHPVNITAEEWDEMLLRMLRAFEWWESGSVYREMVAPPEITQGLQEFAEYFGNLWD